MNAYIIYSILISILLIFLYFIFFFKKKEKNSINLFANSFGYIYDKNLEKAIEKADNNISKNKNVSENAFIKAEILNFNLNDLNNAKKYYKLAVNEIIRNPTRPENRHIEPETILDRFEQLGIQNVLLNQARENLRQEDRRNNETEFDDKITKKFTRVVHSDPQNVHDSEAIEGLKKRYNCLKKYGKNYTGLAENIQNEKAKFVLNKIMENPSYYSHLDETDAEILGRVWARIIHPENSNNRNELIKSLENNLANCANKENVVCTTGRVANILDSLTLLDVNREISQPPVTIEILRKDVMQLVSQMIRKLPEENKVIYENGEADPNYENFAANFKKNIELELRKTFYMHSGTHLEKLIDEAKNAI